MGQMVIVLRFFANYEFKYINMSLYTRFILIYICEFLMSGFINPQLYVV